MNFKLPQTNQVTPSPLVEQVTDTKGLKYSWILWEKNSEGKKENIGIVRCRKIGESYVYEIEETTDPVVEQPTIVKPINRSVSSLGSNKEDERLRFFTLLDEGKCWLEIKHIINIPYPVMRIWTNNPLGGANTKK